MQYKAIFIMFSRKDSNLGPWLTYWAGTMSDAFEFTCSKFKVMAFLAKETTEHRKMLVLLVLGWKSIMTETCGRVVDTFGVKLQLTEGNVDVRKQFGMNERYWKGRWWKDMDGIGNILRPPLLL